MGQGRMIEMALQVYNINDPFAPEIIFSVPDGRRLRSVIVLPGNRIAGFHAGSMAVYDLGSARRLQSIDFRDEDRGPFFVYERAVYTDSHLLAVVTGSVGSRFRQMGQLARGRVFPLLAVFSEGPDSMVGERVPGSCFSIASGIILLLTSASLPVFASRLLFRASSSSARPLFPPSSKSFATSASFPAHPSLRWRALAVRACPCSTGEPARSCSRVWAV